MVTVREDAELYVLSDGNEVIGTFSSKQQAHEYRQNELTPYDASQFTIMPMGARLDKQITVMVKPWNDRELERLSQMPEDVRLAAERVYARPTMENIETLVYVTRGRELVSILQLIRDREKR